MILKTIAAIVCQHPSNGCKNKVGLHFKKLQLVEKVNIEKTWKSKNEVQLWLMIVDDIKFTTCYKCKVLSFFSIFKHRTAYESQKKMR